MSRAYTVLRFACPDRHRSFLDRFRIGADSHRPRPGSEHQRRIEWSEFRGHPMPARSATCIDCGMPIVNMVASIWGVRMHDADADERAWAASLSGSSADTPTPRVPTEGWLEPPPVGRSDDA